MKHYLRAVVIWSILWAGLLAVAYRTSEGPPVCTGPLITGVTDSFPPQCPEPSDALVEVGLLWFAIGLVPAMIVAGVVRGRADRRSIGRTQRAPAARHS